MKVQVSSCIDPEIYRRWKASGMRLSHVISLGLISAEKTPGYLERIKELEEGNARLQKRMTHFATRIAQIESEEV